MHFYNFIQFTCLAFRVCAKSPSLFLSAPSLRSESAQDRWGHRLHQSSGWCFQENGQTDPGRMNLSRFSRQCLHLRGECSLVQARPPCGTGEQAQEYFLSKYSRTSAVAWRSRACPNVAEPLRADGHGVWVLEALYLTVYFSHISYHLLPAGIAVMTNAALLTAATHK